MATKRARRTQQARTQLTPALRTYLTTGDWQRALDEVQEGEAPDAFALYALAGSAIRGHVEPLHELWTTHHGEILAGWRGPGRPWAEGQLKGSGRA